LGAKFWSWKALGGLEEIFRPQKIFTRNGGSLGKKRGDKKNFCVKRGGVI